MPADPAQTVLLFFQEPVADKFLPYDRHLKRLLKPLYNRLHSRQKMTGFSMSFALLVKALRRAGYDVRINDYEHARADPGHPVGLVGFPPLIEGWDLPNPALLGPSLYDHPMLKPDLMNDPRFKRYVVLADWMRDLFASVYGEACLSWHAGIDLDDWPDTRGAAKDVDILIYDKIYRDRNVAERWLLDPVRKEIARRGLSSVEIRYKYYDHRVYRDLLRRSRAMVFLCEHETQGLAYQEAMASGVPILAWDFGMWTDPLWKVFSATPVPASSVPFFGSECGERFRTMAEFGPALTRFIDRLDSYEPRGFVAERLSLESSARIYASAYFALARQTTGSADAESGFVPDGGVPTAVGQGSTG